jgi:hypothetical protein
MYQQFFGELVEAYRIFQELAQEGNKEFGGGDAAKGKKQATELQARVRKVSENAQKKMMEAMEALQKGEMPTQQGAASDPEAQKAWDALPFSYRWAMGFLSPYETARQQQVQIYKILGSLEAPTEEELKQKLGKDPKSASSEELAKATAKLKEEMAMAKGKERYRFLVGRERALIREILPIQAELNALLAAHKEQFKGEAVLPQQVQQVIQAVTGKLQELAQQDIDPNEARSQLKQALAESLKGVEHEGARRLVNAIFDRAGQRAMVFPEALPEQVREALMPQIMASRQFMDGLEASQLRVANRKALAVWSAFMDETQKDRMPGAFRGFFSGLAGFFRATPWLGDDKTHWDDIFEAYQHDLNLYQEVGNRVRSGEAVSAEEALQQISDQGLPWEERNKRIDEDNKDKAEEVKKFHENFKWKKEDAEAVEARAKELINEKDEDFDLMDVFRYVNRPDPDPKVGEALLKMALEMEKEGDYPKTAETIYQLVADTTADDKLKKAAEGALKALRDKDAKPAPAPSASASAGK